MGVAEAFGANVSRVDVELVMNCCLSGGWDERREMRGVKGVVFPTQKI